MTQKAQIALQFCIRPIKVLLYSAKFWWEKIGEFGELNVIHQYFTQPNN